MLSQIFFTGSGESWRQLVHFSRKLRWGLDRSYPDQINWHFDGWGRNVIWKHRPLHWRPVSKVTPAVRHLGLEECRGADHGETLSCLRDADGTRNLHPDLLHCGAQVHAWKLLPEFEMTPHTLTYSSGAMIQYGEVWWLSRLYQTLPSTSWIILPTYVSGLYLWKLTNQGLLVTRWFSRTVVRLPGLSEPGYNSLGCIKQLPPWQVDWLIVLSQETGKVILGKFLVFLTLLKVLSWS